MTDIKTEFYLCYVNRSGTQVYKNFSDPDYAISHWNQLQQLGHRRGYLFCRDSAETAGNIETEAQFDPLDYSDECNYIVLDQKNGTWKQVTLFDGHRELRQNPRLIGFQERDSDI